MNRTARDKALEQDQDCAAAASCPARPPTRRADWSARGSSAASEALANVSKLVGDTAAGLDERLGEEYGEYARKAATTIEEAANQLASKDADELIDDTREFVRKSPGVALAGAAMLGFALVRLVKSGLDQRPQGRRKTKPWRAGATSEDEKPIGELFGRLIDEGKAYAKAELGLVKAIAKPRPRRPRARAARRRRLAVPHRRGGRARA